MAQVIIGVDPHKRSATIEIINDREVTVGQGRFESLVLIDRLAPTHFDSPAGSSHPIDYDAEGGPRGSSLKQRGGPSSPGAASRPPERP